MKKIFLLTLLILTFGISSVSINAAIFTVTRNDDRNALCATGDCSLREAVTAANADASDDTIIFADGLSLITLTNEIVIENAGALSINGRGTNKLTIDGGAGENRIFSTNNVVLNISSITLTGGNGKGANTVKKPLGGAIYAAGGSVTLNSVHVTKNTVEPTLFGAGGGVYYLDGTHHIINSTFSENLARDCGGFYTFSSDHRASGSHLTVTGSTISGNTAVTDGVGGGFCNSNSTVILRNTTVTNNTATLGGGIAQITAILNLGNSIVSGNTATRVGSDFFTIGDGGKITSDGSNLINITPATEAQFTHQPTDFLDAHLVLGTLAMNGGEVPTHALLPGSLLIDAGDNSLTSEQFDARGFPRIVDGNGDGAAVVDIGAFEVQPQRRRVRRDRGLFFSF